MTVHSHRTGCTNRRPWCFAATGFTAGLASIIAAATLLRAGEPDAAVGTPRDRAAVATGESTAKNRSPQTTMQAYRRDVVPLFEKYCHDCHSGEFAEAGLALDEFSDIDSITSARKQWEKILTMVDGGIMPPIDHDPRPTADERKRIVAWIDDAVFSVDCEAGPDPGRVTIRRLNRAEYNNTIRDLVGVDFRPAKDFPSDDVGYGFDNIGDVLSLPPLLMEKYLDAAEEIAEAAIVDPSQATTQRKERKQLQHEGGARLDGQGIHALASNGSVFATFAFPQPGEYILRVEAGAQQAGPETARMEFRLDDKTVEAVDVKASRDRPRMHEVRVPVETGTHRFAAAFVNDYYNPDDPDPKQRGDRNLYIGRLEVQGPFLPYEKLPETHRRIVFVDPAAEKSPAECARRILRKFATRAFRRPVTDDEVNGFARFVELAIEQGDSFERGVQVAVQAVLVSPHFLFRIEGHPDPDDPKAVHRIGDYELATRLSYFLWSSMPDDELFALAGKGELHKPGVLKKQVRRMLADPKSRALVRNFAGQWLNLRLLDEAAPDPKAFPGVDRRLKRDMRRETEMLFETVMRDDRSLLDFLDAKFTFVNRRLAKHYGIDGVEGDEFRKVSLDGRPRAGVLTHASILTLTSDPTRTSPVKRGKWVLENIFDQPPPPAPPGVPNLEETKVAAENATLREQMELHRKNPTCASCHVQMDAIGFGLENFDAVGRWRDREGEAAIDSSGELPSGDRFNGPLELIQILKKRDARFCRCLTRKLLTYALGRGLEYYDRCAVDEIVEAVSKDDYRFSTLVIEIVNSDPFQLRRGDGR